MKILRLLNNPFAKVTIFSLIFFGALWAKLGFSGAIWAVDLLLQQWLQTLEQMNLLVIAFSLVVGMIGVMWVLQVKLDSEGGGKGAKYEKLYNYLALGIFAAIVGILVSIVLV